MAGIHICVGAEAMVKISLHAELQNADSSKLREKTCSAQALNLKCSVYNYYEYMTVSEIPFTFGRQRRNKYERDICQPMSNKIGAKM